MLTAVSANAPGDFEDGKLVFHLLGEDQKQFQLALTPRAAFETLSSLLFHLNDLPQSNSAQPVLIDGSVSFGFDSQVKLIMELNLNGLKIAIRPPDSESEALATQLTRYLEKLKTQH